MSFIEGKLPPDYSVKITWKMGVIRLVFVAGIIWMLLILTALLFHIWSCQSSVGFFSGSNTRYLIMYDLLVS